MPNLPTWQVWVYHGEPPMTMFTLVQLLFCVYGCLCKLQLWLQLLLQYSHEYVLSPVWVCMCLFRSPPWLKLILQYSHCIWYALSSEWCVLLWIARDCLLTLPLLSFVCWRVCCWRLRIWSWRCQWFVNHWHMISPTRTNFIMQTTISSASLFSPYLSNCVHA